jgi:hypothetical protein
MTKRTNNDLQNKHMQIYFTKNSIVLSNKYYYFVMKYY